jgi:hypothetical protein
MADPGLVDLVTPPSSPVDQLYDENIPPDDPPFDEPEPDSPPIEEAEPEDSEQLEPEPEDSVHDEPEQQQPEQEDSEPDEEEEPVSEGGPGRAVIQVAEGGPGRRGVINKQRLGFWGFQADNWSPLLPVGSKEMPCFLDLTTWIPLVFEVDEIETTVTVDDEIKTTVTVDDEIKTTVTVADGSAVNYNLVFHDGKSKKSWAKMFKTPKGDFNVFSLVAHSAQNPSDLKKYGRNDPGQVMSFGENNFVRFTEVAKFINAATTKIKDKYDLVLLGCCQGDKFAPLVKNMARKGGLIVYYGGEDESALDGVAAGNVVEFWEVILQKIKEGLDRSEPIDLKSVFEESFVEVGVDYLAPTGQEDELEPNGDYKYLDLIMNKSVEAAKKDPKFKLEFTYAGDMHAMLDGVDLVTPELLLRRERWFEDKQILIDSGAVKAKGKRRRG